MGLGPTELRIGCSWFLLSSERHSHGALLTGIGLIVNETPPPCQACLVLVESHTVVMEP